jgi:hypothetical protein
LIWLSKIKQSIVFFPVSNLEFKLCLPLTVKVWDDNMLDEKCISFRWRSTAAGVFFPALMTS